MVGSGAGEDARAPGKRAGDMLLQHDVEVGAAEAIGADTRAAGEALGLGPLAQFVVQVERRGGEVNVGVGTLGVERRG